MDIKKAFGTLIFSFSILIMVFTVAIGIQLFKGEEVEQPIQKVAHSQPCVIS